MRRRHRSSVSLLLWGLLAALAVVSASGAVAPVAAQDTNRLFITLDKSHLVLLPGEPFTKVAIANPNTVDVQVLTPNQILLNGKTIGGTSLLVFYPNNRVHNFDVVVQPAPALLTAAPPPSQEPHAVLVHRADQVSERIFLRDRDQSWIELGTVKPEPESARK